MLTFFGGSTGPKSITQAINDSVSKRSFTNERTREKTKVQLAVQTYLSQNGKLPEKIEDLIPLYVESLPIDPNTGAPFIYKVDGKKYYVYNSDYDPNKKSTSGVTTASTKTAEEKERIILASLKVNPDDKPFVYDPSEKRDPFAPFDLVPRKQYDPNKSELEQFDLSQLKLKAVILGIGDPKALVEDATGKGYNLTEGTKIGPNNGTVEKIEKDKIIIIEELVKFTGEKEVNKVEMKLNDNSSGDSDSKSKFNKDSSVRNKK